MTPKDVLDYVTGMYPEIEIRQEADETVLLYNPAGQLPTGLPFLSIARGKASWRMSIVQPEALYVARFGAFPRVLDNGGFLAGEWDYDAPDVVTPDPRRAPWGWISVVNPSLERFENLKPHIAAGLQQAMAGARSKLELKRHRVAGATH